MYSLALSMRFKNLLRINDFSNYRVTNNRGSTVYINDLPDNLTHKFKLYADDGKLIEELGTDRGDDDIQSDINSIVKWCET